jgi:hypothetical protein
VDKEIEGKHKGKMIGTEEWKSTGGIQGHRSIEVERYKSFIAIGECELLNLLLSLLMNEERMNKLAKVVQVKEIK